MSTIPLEHSINYRKHKKNQNHKIGKECHERCTTFHYIALFHMKSAFTAFQDKGCMNYHLFQMDSQSVFSKKKKKSKSQNRERMS